MRLLCQIYFQTRIKDRCAEHFLWSWLQLNATILSDESTLVQVMAWCRQATSHYLSQWWPRSMAPQPHCLCFFFSRIRLKCFPQHDNHNVICEISKRFVHQNGRNGQTIFGEISACDEFWTYCHDRYRYWSQKGSIPLMSRLPWLYWRYCYLSSEIAVDNALTLSVARENQLFPILADCFVFRISYIFHGIYFLNRHKDQCFGIASWSGLYVLLM